MRSVVAGLVLLLSLAGQVSGSSQATNADCSDGLGWSGACPSASNDGSTVSIGATRPGGSDQGTREYDGWDIDDVGDVAEEALPGAPAPPPADDCSPTDPTSCAAPPVTSVTPDAPVIVPTLADVARFAPASVAIVDEPDGVGIVGMPMNFVTTPVVHEQAGTLFGLPVTVRFTPVGVVFVHGDGTQRTTTSGGATWAELGLPQFSATGTSHAYASRGTYTARALIRYAAEFNLGRGWNPIDGVLEIPTAATDLQIFEARTALVDRTCAESPAGPGC